MAKKKIKISVKEKLHYKKPLKNCNPAVKDISRIRNNEQAKLRRLKAKFEAIPTGKKGKGRKKEADALRKEIKAFERGIDDLKRDVKAIRGACNVMADNSAKIKSAKLKEKAIERKLKQMYENRDLRTDVVKKLNSEALKLQNRVRELQAKNEDILYQVNKGLGFSPVEVAERLEISKKTLKKRHAADFDEEYLEGEELEEITEGGGGGAAGVGDLAGLEGLEETEEEELEVDESGYVEEMDDVFWQVSQDFTRNEKNQLGIYDYVTVSWQGGGSYRFSGKNLSLITMKFDEMVRWCNAQSAKAKDDSAARITKYVMLDRSQTPPTRRRLKYYGYVEK